MNYIRKGDFLFNVFDDLLDAFNARIANRRRKHIWGNINREDMKRVIGEQRLGQVATVCPDGTLNLSALTKSKGAGI